MKKITTLLFLLLVAFLTTSRAQAQTYVTVTTASAFETAIANKNPYIRLGADITETNAIDLTANLQLDLNGYTYTHSTCINVRSGISLVVIDSSPSQTGKAVPTDLKFAIAWAAEGGSVTINSGNYIADGRAVLEVSSGGTLTINGGTFTTTNTQGYIINAAGTLNINGGTIIGSDNGKAPVYVDWSGAATVTDGAIYAGNSTENAFEVSTSGGKLTLPTGKEDGGAVVVSSKWAKPGTKYLNYVLGDKKSTVPMPHYRTPGTAFALPTPAVLGYQFDGWYTTSDFSGTALTSIAASDAADYTLYGKLSLSQNYVTVTTAAEFTTAIGYGIPKIRLGADISAGSVSLSSDRHIDLNGHALTTDGSFETTNSASTLYFEDLSSAGTGSFNGVLYLTKGNLQLDGGTLNLTSLSISVNYGTTFTMNGGKITGTMTNDNLISNNGTFTMNGGTIIGVDGGKAPVYVNWAGITTVNDGAIYAGNAAVNAFEVSSSGGKVTLPAGMVDGGAVVVSQKWAKPGTKFINYIFQYNGNTIALKHYYTPGIAAYTLPTPAISGMEFVGWYTTSDFSGTAITEIPASAAIDYTLYPKFIAGYVTVTTGDKLYTTIMDLGRPNVRLGADFSTSTSPIKISAEDSHIDLNGHILTLNAQITVNSKLTIEDKSAAKTGEIDEEAEHEFSNNGTLVMTGGTIKNTSSAPSAMVLNSGVMTLEGGRLENHSTLARAVYTNGTLNIKGGTIIGCDGGKSPIFLDNAASATTVTDGAIYAGNAAVNAFEVSISGGTITLPAGMVDGGAVVVSDTWAIAGTKYINYIYPEEIDLVAAPHYYTTGTEVTLPTIENSGMTFLGWSKTSASSTNDLIKTIPTTSVENLTLYPVWDVTTGIGEAAAGTAKVIGGIGEIRIEGNAQDVRIYNAGGSLVSAGESLTHCTSGLYIVKANGSTTKVIVK